MLCRMNSNRYYNFYSIMVIPLMYMLHNFDYNPILYTRHSDMHMYYIHYNSIL